SSLDCTGHFSGCCIAVPAFRRHSINPKRRNPDMQPTFTPQLNTVNRASGSSFYLAMRILPREKREAMLEIYSFCKTVDDIADSDDARSLRLARLKAWRHEIEEIYHGNTPVRLDRLAWTIDRFNLQLEDFLAILEGMEIDTEDDTCAPDLAQLEYYCDRVAC